jgi:hypothetical protein
MNQKPTPDSCARSQAGDLDWGRLPGVIPNMHGILLGCSPCHYHCDHCISHRYYIHPVAFKNYSLQSDVGAQGYIIFLDLRDKIYYLCIVIV